MNRIKMLHLITGLDVGGAEKVVFDLSRSLKVLGHEVFVIGISDKDLLRELFIEQNVNVRTLNVLRTVPSFVRGYRELYVFIKKNDIKIVHAHMAHALIMTVLIKFAIPQLRIVFTSHNYNLGSKTREVLVKLFKPFRNSDIIFSKNMQKSIYKKDAIVIPNGIDTLQYELDLKKNAVFTFLCIGRIEPVKNHKYLVDIAAELQKEFEFEIHIVGEGYLKKELISYINEKKVNPRFKFLGYRKDINVICNQSHVFVLPSLWEGLPISLLEAGASSMPVISTPVGSIPELIDDSSGYLAELNEFLVKMKFAYDNYDDAIIKGKRLREKIKDKYDLNYIVEEHIKVYKKLL